MRKTKYISSKILALLMAATLSVGTFTSCSPVADNARAEVLSAEEQNEVNFLTDKLSASTTAGKKETVYVIKDADGANKQIVVSEWLKNPEAAGSLEDETNLKNIEVVKGDVSFKADGEKLTWTTSGTDVYYRGTSDKKTPVDVKVSYKLDGKDVSASELKGANGHLTITFEYTNNTGKVIRKDKADYRIYKPYMMVSGLILDNSVASNISVTGGSLVNDGDRSIVFGVGFPGLADSIGLSAEKEEEKELRDMIPDGVVVECDVQNFEPVITLTVANGDALNKLGFNGEVDASDVKGKVKELSEGMSKIVNGAASLSDGIKTLNTGAGALKDGVDTLYNGAGELYKGSGTLASGVKALRDGLKSLYDKTPELAKGVSAAYDGSKQLAAGANTLVANNDSLNSGAKQLSDGLNLLNTTLNNEESKKSLAALTKGSNDFKTNMNALNTGMGQITAGYSYSAGELKVIIESLEAMINAGTLDQQTAPLVGGLIQYYKSLYTQVQTVSGSVNALNTGYAQIDGGITTVAGSMGQLATNATALANGAHSLQTGVSTYTAGVSSLATGAGTLSNGLKELNSAVPTLQSGVTALYNGSKEAYAGAEKLNTGAKALYEGTGNLKDGVKALTDGIEKLLNGSVELASGSKKLNEEGVQKLTGLVSENLDKYLERFNELKTYAAENDSYAGGLVETSSVYIFKTE